MAPGKWGHGRAVCRRQMFNFPVSYRLRFMQSQAQIHTVRQYVGYTVSYSQAHMVGPSYSLCHTVFAIQSRKHLSCSGPSHFYWRTLESSTDPTKQAANQPTQSKS